MDHPFHKKNLPTIILILILVAFGFWTGFFGDFFGPLFEDKNNAFLVIDYGESRRAFKGEVTDQMTILDALIVSSMAGNFEFRYVLLNDQTDILKIDNFAEDGLNEKSWNFYLNDQKLETEQIHKIQIKERDKILVKFE